MNDRQRKLLNDAKLSIDAALLETGEKPAPPTIIPWIEFNCTRGTKMGEWRTKDCPAGYEGVTAASYCQTGRYRFRDGGVETFILTTPSSLTQNWFTGYFIHYAIGGIQTLEWAVDGRADQHASTYRHWFDREATRQIIDKARIITESTGKNIVVLENETAHKPFWQGDLSKVFHDETHESLRMLRGSDIEWWFNFPRILPDVDGYQYPGRNAWSKRLVSYVAQQVPKAKFMCPEGWNGNPKLRSELEAIVGADRVIDRCFMRETKGNVDGTSYGNPAEIIGQYGPDSTTVTFSGVPHWVSTAEAWKAVTG